MVYCIEMKCVDAFLNISNTPISLPETGELIAGFGSGELAAFLTDDNGY